MNYTEKYHLPQWEETDRIMRTDFNQMCADMETGLERNAQAAAEAAKLPYVVGSYVGTAGAQDVNLGFRPSALIIGVAEDSNVQSVTLAKIVILTAESPTKKIKLTATGFHMEEETGKYSYPAVNHAGGRYQFIALR